MRQTATGGTALVWFSTLVRIALGGIFIVAGALKAINPQESVQAVHAYQLLPASLEKLVGWGLPFFEIALGLLLVAGLLTRLTGIVAVTLMVIFIAGVVSAWARGLSIDCGCFGGGGQVAPGEAKYAPEVLRDVGFLLMGLWLVIWPQTRFSLDLMHQEEIDE